MSFHLPACSISPCTCDDRPAGGTPSNATVTRNADGTATLTVHEPFFPTMRPPRPGFTVSDEVLDTPVGYAHATRLASLGVTR